MSVWQWLGAGIAFFVLMWVLSAWAEAEDGCEGTVVRNMWGWPTCVEGEPRGR